MGNDNPALRSAIAEVASRYHGIELPGGETDPVVRILARMNAALLRELDAAHGGSGDEIGGPVLARLGEEAARDDG